MCLRFPEGYLMGLNELWAVCMFFYVERFVSFRSFLWLAMLARSRVATMRFSRADKRSFALPLDSFSPFISRSLCLAGGSEERRFTLSFSRSFPFLPLVPEHSCRWDNIPGLCSGSGRALRCLMMGLALQHLSFLLWETWRGNLKCAIMCCYNLRTQFLKGIGLHTNTSTYQQTLTEVSVKKANSLTHSVAGGMQVWKAIKHCKKQGGLGSLRNAQGSEQFMLYQKHFVIAFVIFRQNI